MMEFFLQAKEIASAFREEIVVFSLIILALGLFQNLIYLIQLPLAAMELLRMKLRKQEEQNWWLVTSDITLPISILIPAYNEEVTIVNTVVATMATQYPTFEIIVSNDGSKDRTLEVLKERFDLQLSRRVLDDALTHQRVRGIYTSPSYPNLVVIDKENGGRSDALNAAINTARYPIFCTLDADSLLDPSALLKTVQPFIEDPEHMVATGGTVRILNGCRVEHGVIKEVRLPRNLLARFQTVEYMRAFLMGRLAWSRIGILTIISGAFAIFKRDVAVAVGGFGKDTMGEDFELVMKIHRHHLGKNIPYRIRFVPEPVCWTEVPETLKVMRSQRIRWQQGGLEVFFKHRAMLCNPRYGRIGLVAYPLMLISDVLGPLAELLGIILMPLFYLLGALNIQFMIAFICMFFVFGVFISTMSLVLEEISLKRFSHARGLLILAFMAVVENFGYRQLNNYWRIVGWMRFIRKKRVWGEMTRIGTKS